jgi:hypothetical protein
MGCSVCTEDDCRIFRGRINCCEFCARSSNCEVGPVKQELTLP